VLPTGARHRADYRANETPTYPHQTIYTITITARRPPRDQRKRRRRTRADGGKRLAITQN